MSGRLPAGLRMYRLLSAAAGPFAPILLARRAKRGKEHHQRLPERRGESRIARPDDPLVWLHGASVGELASVLPLIDRICARGINMLVTTGTVTSGGLAEQRLPPGAIHQFVPFDIPRFVRRFLDHWQPDLALFVESDLWPNMMIEASARGIPMILVNARLSKNSFERWRRLPNSIADLLRRLDLCLAGTSSDAERLSELGASNVVTTGNLKLDVPAPPADPTELATLQRCNRRPAGDCSRFHPCRRGERDHRGACPPAYEFSGSADIDRAAPSRARARRRRDRRSQGLNAALRSRGELPKRTTQIYVADTVGELGLFYRLAPAVFIGGSLVRHGGQNPIEAAKLRAQFCTDRMSGISPRYTARSTARMAPS